MVAQESILDARIVPVGAEKFRIEYNPNKSRGRQRFSVAHEIAHTFFPDCAEVIRHRGRSAIDAEDSWQVEMLCNLAAAEFLMPIGTGAMIENETVSIDNILRLQAKYEVSTESMSIKFARITDEPWVIFAAKSSSKNQPIGYSIEYSVPSRAATFDFRRGFEVGRRTILSQCTAVGFTAKGKEHWAGHLPELYIECAGIPPYPGHYMPRIVGIARAAEEGASKKRGITFLKGDAIEPKTPGPKVIAQIVNDKTMNWGGRGFAYRLKKRLPKVQDDFQTWVLTNPKNLSLGSVHISSLSDECSVVSMVAQHGYGPSIKPRIRYGALMNCLGRLAEVATERKATVHMPRIGTGNAGGNWSIIQELIQDTLLRRGIQVTVHDLPGSNVSETQAILGLE
jgi:O-acetyl-ADP-ribose deacetylase (regulator of RNase III)